MIHAYALGRARREYGECAASVYGGVRSTFRDLHDRVGWMAAALDRHGFRPGDRLALLLPNELEYIELMYACAWLGVVAVPLNTRLALGELDRVLADARPRGLIRHSSLPAPTVDVPWQVVLNREALDMGRLDPPEPIFDERAPLALVYTSGTTGHPKGVVVTHANMIANVEHVHYWMPADKGGVYLHAAPMFHILDLPFMFGAPVFGTCQVTIPKFSPRSFCEAVQRERVSRTTLVPTMISLLTQFPDLDRYDLTSLEEIAYGGSPMTPALIRQTRAAFPHVRLQQGYGLSEAGILTVLQDHEHTDGRLASCGRTCPGIEMQVVDSTGAEVPAGHCGEFVARGANVMSHYWNDVTETARVIRDGQLRTGDVGYQDAEGFFFILDRIKDMVVTGGENVYSGEVEAVILQHPAVREAAVFGIPDAEWGEVVAACVVLKPGQTLSADELSEYSRKTLAHYKIPRHIEFSDAELPKNASGKILKRLLRQRYWAHQQRAVS